MYIHVMQSLTWLLKTFTVECHLDIDAVKGIWTAEKSRVRISRLSDNQGGQMFCEKYPPKKYSKRRETLLPKMFMILWILFSKT
jgi:hypothetical protein